MRQRTIDDKPLRAWEWREYKKGSLIENGIALNKTGTFIWKMCDGKNTIKKIIDAIIDNFDVNKNIAKKDVFELVELLDQENSLK